MLGLIFFHVAAFGCRTFEHDAGSFSGGLHFGYFGANNPYGGNGCVQYSGDNSELDGVIRFGRFIGVFGSLLTWAVFAVVMTGSCFRYPRPELVFLVVAICMVVLSLFSFLLLVGKSSDSFYGLDIKLASGGVLAILAAFIWFGAAVSVVFFMKERPRNALTAAAATASSSTVAVTKPVAPSDPTNQVPSDPTSRVDDDDTESGIAAAKM